jgi:hypothetical protein
MVWQAVRLFFPEVATLSFFVTMHLLGLFTSCTALHSFAVTHLFYVIDRTVAIVVSVYMTKIFLS